MYDAFRQGLTGIHAATIVPMRADFSVDEDALADHIGWIAATPGIRGLLVNGHAGENFVLDRAEKRRVVEIARQVSPEGCVIVSGVNAESSLEAAREAAEMEAAGADGLLVFPPNSWALSHADDAVLLHHRYIRDATSLPLLLYGAPIASGTLAYPPSVLARLAGASHCRHQGRKLGGCGLRSKHAPAQGPARGLRGFGVGRRASADQLHHRHCGEPGEPCRSRARSRRRPLASRILG